MDEHQQEVVKKVFKKFQDSDGNEKEWTELDEKMWMLDWLADGELAVEATVKLQEHKYGDPRCEADHPREKCFVPTIMEAISAILDLYAKTGFLPKNNRFVLMYYLMLSHLGMIIS